LKALLKCSLILFAVFVAPTLNFSPASVAVVLILFVVFDAVSLIFTVVLTFAGFFVAVVA
jgi:hypothetical protein